MRRFFNLPVHTRDDYLFTNPCLKSKIRQINKTEQIKRDQIGNREKSSDKTTELKIMATRKRKASEENPKKTNTEFLWTDDDIQLLLQTSFNLKSKLSWESV